MRLALSTLAALPLAACAPTPTDPAPVPPVDNGGECNAAAAQGHIGHQATAEMGAAILKDSGARTLRWGAPNSAWTMDYRIDRVNVRYDANMTITEITCG